MFCQQQKRNNPVWWKKYAQYFSDVPWRHVTMSSCNVLPKWLSLLQLIITVKLCCFVLPYSQLSTVRGFLQQAAPLLLKLNEKAVAALRERDEYIYERDQAVEEREQVCSLELSLVNYFLTLGFYLLLKDQRWLHFIWVVNTSVTQQITEEWKQTNLNLQTAREEISDLNLQVTILTSGKDWFRNLSFAATPIFSSLHLLLFYSSILSIYWCLSFK